MSFESSQIVTGPSSSNSIFMWEPNLPVRTSPANEISGISIIGALIGSNVEFEGGQTPLSGLLAFVAVVLAMINVVGGFAVTNRMLNMIAGKKRGGA